MNTDKEKQIEELTAIIADMPNSVDCIVAEAEYLYAKGYRKQVVGEWIVDVEYYDDDYSECNTRKVFVCSKCGRTERRKEPYCNCGARMKGVDE